MRNLVLRATILASSCLLGSESRPWYQQEIPNGGAVMFQGQLWPGVGHNVREGGGVRNPFGLDFQTAGFTWSAELCGKDSDGDGRSNGEELGDPACVWQKGDAPSRTENITHPGFKDGPGWDDGGGGGDGTDADCKRLDGEAGLIVQNITMPAFEIPAQATTYQCVSGSFPDDRAYHAVRFRPINRSPGLVHHMVLYTCATAPRSGSYPCWGMTKECSSALFAWAVGGEDFCAPNVTGFPVGGGGGAVHVVLQLHYDNPNRIAGVVDASGVSVEYTTKLRQHDSALVRTGVPIKSISIPANTASHSLVGTCPSSQTKGMDGPRTVYASLLHMHYYGKTIVTEQYRGGSKVADLGRSDAWDFDLQRVQKFAAFREFLPGDELRTTCTYNTTGVSSVVVGGEDTSDEMCFNFLAMYPPPGAAVCESAAANGSKKKWPTYVGIGAGAVAAVAAVTGFVLWRKRRAAAHSEPLMGSA